MWVNIDFSLDIADIINYLKELDYQGPIYLSYKNKKKHLKFYCIFRVY